MQLEPYLSFNGNCEDALSFYSKIFNGHITVMNRYEASPFAAHLPPERLKQVIHARFRAPSIRFLASDRYESYPEVRRSGSSRRSARADLSTCRCRVRPGADDSACSPTATASIGW
jgi:PhnB protein